MPSFLRSVPIALFLIGIQGCGAPPPDEPDPAIGSLEQAVGNKCSKVICTALDACHVAGTCDAKTGVCSNPLAPNGTSCSDGNKCTQSDSCQNGICTGSNPIVGTVLDQCHVA